MRLTVMHIAYLRHPVLPLLRFAKEGWEEVREEEKGRLGNEWCCLRLTVGHSGL